MIKLIKLNAEKPLEKKTFGQDLRKRTGLIGSAMSACSLRLSEGAP